MPEPERWDLGAREGSFHQIVTPAGKTELTAVAEAARAFVWEPENWEAWQDSKGSNSVAWPPEFLLLAEAVEKAYGAPPVEAEEPGVTT